MKFKTHLLSALAFNFYLSILLIKILLVIHHPHNAYEIVWTSSSDDTGALTFGMMQAFAITTITLFAVVGIETYGHSRIMVGDGFIAKRNKLHSPCIGSLFTLMGVIPIFLLVRLMALSDLASNVNYTVGEWLELALASRAELVLIAVSGIAAHMLHMLEDSLTERGIYVFSFRERRFKRWTLIRDTYKYDDTTLNGLVMGVSAILFIVAFLISGLIVKLWTDNVYDADTLWDAYGYYYFTYLFFTILWMLGGTKYQKYGWVKGND